jgi:ABC-2 type transport system permease protein
MTGLVRGLWVVAYREFLRLFHQPARMVSSFATPLLFFGLFGAGFNRLVGQMAPGVDFVTFMYPGILAMTVIMPAVFSGMSVVWDREFGFLREVLVAPLSRTGIVLGKIIGGAGIATVEGLLLLVLAPAVGVHVRLLNFASLVPLLLLLSGSLAAFGVLVGTRLKTQEAFQTVMALLIFPLIFLSGIFFPVAAVPRWLGALAKANPVTYGVDAIRHVLLGAAASERSARGFAIGLTVLGHRMSPVEEAGMLIVLGGILVAGAARSFAHGD